mmetsp:Transcript_30712/g.91012  ORF Transcript_30712/g.91012 Transcript_30712/m.91012 type:complete len:222 (+) Transcript_30712:808-1473(+)
MLMDAAGGLETSPSARTAPVTGSTFGSASTRRKLSTANRPILVFEKGSESENCVGPTPVDQMHMPYGMAVPSCSMMVVPSICLTTPLRSSTPSLMSLRAAYSRRLESNEPNTSRASTSVTRIARATSGYRFLRSSWMKSHSSPATSTPVGPPPTMTICSRRLYSALVRPGMLALAMSMVSFWWISSACFTSRKKLTFSCTPGMPKVLPWEPVQMASLSYLT